MTVSRTRPLSFRQLAAASICALALPAAHSAAAAGPACGGGDNEVDVPSLTVALAPAPATVRAGRAFSVPVTVERTAAPAAGVLVRLGVKHGTGAQDETFVAGRTDAGGRVSLSPRLPASATGPLWVTVVAHAPLVSIPCHRDVSEHGSTEGSWGRAVR